MRVVNVMRDGTVRDDLAGHVVRMDDARALYAWLRKGAARNG